MEFREGGACDADKINIRTDILSKFLRIISTVMVQWKPSLIPKTHTEWYSDLGTRLYIVDI